MSQHRLKANPRRSAPSVCTLYPILVVQGDLFEVQQLGGDLRMVPTRHIRYRHALTRGQKQIDYRIDVVTESYFSTLLRMIDRSGGQVLRRYSRLIRSNEAVTNEYLARHAKAGDVRPAL
jgi:hypothetical protein